MHEYKNSKSVKNKCAVTLLSNVCRGNHAGKIYDLCKLSSYINISCSTVYFGSDSHQCLYCLYFWLSGLTHTHTYAHTQTQIQGPGLHHVAINDFYFCQLCMTLISVFVGTRLRYRPKGLYSFYGLNFFIAFLET